MKKHYLKISARPGLFYSLALRFKNLLKRIDNLLATGQFEAYGRKKQEQLLEKLRMLYTQLSGINPSYALKVAGVAACFALISSTANAQSPAFELWEPSPIEFNSIYASATASSNEWLVADGAFADIDDDGDLDAMLLVGMPVSHIYCKIAYFENDNGTYVENPGDNPFAMINDETSSVVSIDVADYDNDGQLDLIFVYKEDTGFTFVHMVLDEGGFISASVSDINENHSDFVLSAYPSVKFMDVNNDGLPDLVGTYSTPTEDVLTRTLFQLADHTFESVSTPGIPISTPIETPSLFCQVADVDGDGDDDLFACYLNESESGDEPESGDYLKIVYYQNDGLGNFTVIDDDTEIPLPMANMSLLSPALLADLDSDGDIDVFQPGDIVGATGTNQAAFRNLGGSSPAVPVSPLVAIAAFVVGGFGILRRNRKKHLS